MLNQTAFVWEDEVPVSLACRTRVTPNGVGISIVYTPEQYRRKGYASACVAALSEHFINQGYKYCFLFTDLANPTSNHIYQAIGYQPAGDCQEYSFVES
ncbi:GCN5-related N-acetyltransferase [Calothrix sp. NIES-4071]|nr:GCN5-related N-acetyltransferase [Calothrix sp. NIES-4071]BAZ59954.1 GCN5-related N-acetyltransferase [Calothrix sp. NIES-4105]